MIFLQPQVCAYPSLAKDVRITVLAVITKKHGISIEVESLQLKLSPPLSPAYVLMEFIEIYV